MFNFTPIAPHYHCRFISARKLPLLEYSFLILKYHVPVISGIIRKYPRVYLTCVDDLVVTRYWITCRKQYKTKQEQDFHKSALNLTLHTLGDDYIMSEIKYNSQNKVNVVSEHFVVYQGASLFI